MYLEEFNNSKSEIVEVTDDYSLIKKYNLAMKYVVKGDRLNVKITYIEDVYLADRIFQIKSERLELSEIELSRALKGKVIKYLVQAEESEKQFMI